jgi:hypothetical protein
MLIMRIGGRAMNAAAPCGACLMLLVTTSALAQVPLAEVARREAERRKAVDAPAKVYTNEDLKRSTTPLTVAATTSKPSDERETPAAGAAGAGAAEPQTGGAAQPSASATSDASEPDAAQEEAKWRARIEGARQELSRARMFGDALQSRINGLWADFTARDDPAQRELIAQERVKALNELDRVKGEIKAFTDKIAEIEEDARKANVPPGWLR